MTPATLTKVDDPVGVVNIPPLSVATTGDNPRSMIDADQLDELTDSIRQLGVLVPIIVTPGGEGAEYHLVAGHRRLQAVQKLGLDTIPATVISSRQHAESGFEVAVAENLQRENMSVTDESLIVKRLVASTGSVAKAAKAVCKSETWVRGRLALADLSPDVLQHIAIGNVPSTIAVEYTNQVSDPRAVDLMIRYHAALRSDNSGDEPTLKEARHEAGDILGHAIDWAREQDATTLQVWPGDIDPTDVLYDLDTIEQLDHAKSCMTWQDKNKWFKLDDDSIDAARAFGVLLEVTGRKWNRDVKWLFVTDAAWLVDRWTQRSEQILDSIESTVDATRKRLLAGKELTGAQNVCIGRSEWASNTNPSRSQGPVKPSPDEVAKKMTLAMNHNHGIWAKLLKQGVSSTITNDHVDLVFEALVSSDQWAGLAQWITLFDPQHVDTKGKRPKYPKPKDVDAKLAREWCDKAKTPHERITRFVGLYIAAAGASYDAVAQSNRPRWKPGYWKPELAAALRKLGGKWMPKGSLDGRGY